jgi:hypothetical protein
LKRKVNRLEDDCLYGGQSSFFELNYLYYEADIGFGENLLISFVAKRCSNFENSEGVHQIPGKRYLNKWLC